MRSLAWNRGARVAEVQDQIWKYVTPASRFESPGLLVAAALLAWTEIDALSLLGGLQFLLSDEVGKFLDTMPQLVNAIRGYVGLSDFLGEVVRMVADLESTLGDDIQLGLDTAGDALRHLSPHSKGIANMLNPVPRFINTLSYYVNNHQFDFIAWSPPLFRIRTPNGLALCGAMNASMPGSCADVNGQPHAVDIALLQYVLTEAQRR